MHTATIRTAIGDREQIPDETNAFLDSDRSTKHHRWSRYGCANTIVTSSDAEALDFFTKKAKKTSWSNGRLPTEHCDGSVRRWRPCG